MPYDYLINKNIFETPMSSTREPDRTHQQCTQLKQVQEQVLQTDGRDGVRGATPETSW